MIASKDYHGHILDATGCWLLDFGFFTNYQRRFGHQVTMSQRPSGSLPRPGSLVAVILIRIHSPGLKSGVVETPARAPQVLFTPCGQISLDWYLPQHTVLMLQFIIVCNNSPEVEISLRYSNRWFCIDYFSACDTSSFDDYMWLKCLTNIIAGVISNIVRLIFIFFHLDLHSLKYCF